MSERLTVELPDALVELIAERVLELLDGRVPSEPEPWVGVAQAARYLGCARDRVYALVSKRAIPYKKDGRRVLFRRSELDRWLDEGGATRT
jgi:excisionase family DNA binding protein